MCPDLWSASCVVVQEGVCTYGMGHKKYPFRVFFKSLFSRATETERLEHGTVRSNGKLNGPFHSKLNSPFNSKLNAHSTLHVFAHF